MNPITDCPGLLCTISIYQPFVWRAVCFALIASTLAPTKGNDVMRHGSRAIRIRNGNPVIGMRLARGAVQWMCANGTASIEVVKCKVPILCREVVGKFEFPSTVLLARYRTSFSVIRRPFPGHPINAVFYFLVSLTAVGVVLFLVSLVVFTHMINVAFVPGAHPPFSLFGVFNPHLLKAIFVFLSVLFAFLGYKFLVFPAVSFVVLAKIILVFLTVTAVSFVTTRLTVLAKRSGRFVEVIEKFCRFWFQFITNCALFNLFHGLVSYWSYITKGCGQAVGLAFQVVNYATLAHSLIIAQKRASLWT